MALISLPFFLSLSLSLFLSPSHITYTYASRTRAKRATDSLVTHGMPTSFVLYCIVLYSIQHSWKLLYLAWHTCNHSEYWLLYWYWPVSCYIEYHAVELGVHQTQEDSYTGTVHVGRVYHIVWHPIHDSFERKQHNDDMLSTPSLTGTVHVGRVYHIVWHPIHDSFERKQHNDDMLSTPSLTGTVHVGRVYHIVWHPIHDSFERKQHNDDMPINTISHRYRPCWPSISHRLTPNTWFFWT